MTYLDIHVHVRVELLWLGTAAHVSAICLPDAITHDQISQALPLCINEYRGVLSHKFGTEVSLYAGLLTQCLEQR